MCQRVPLVPLVQLSHSHGSDLSHSRVSYCSGWDCHWLVKPTAWRSALPLHLYLHNQHMHSAFPLTIDTHPLNFIPRSHARSFAWLSATVPGRLQAHIPPFSVCQSVWSLQKECLALWPRPIPVVLLCCVDSGSVSNSLCSFTILYMDTKYLTALCYLAIPSCSIQISFPYSWFLGPTEFDTYYLCPWIWKKIYWSLLGMQ